MAYGVTWNPVLTIPVAQSPQGCQSMCIRPMLKVIIPKDIRKDHWTTYSCSPKFKVSERQGFTILADLSETDSDSGLIYFAICQITF